MTFSHFDAKGQAVMVDVSGKEPTLRTAIALLPADRNVYSPGDEVDVHILSGNVEMLEA